MPKSQNIPQKKVPAKRPKVTKAPPAEKKTGQIDQYEYKSKDIPITVTVNRVKGEFVPIYEVRISSISRTVSLKPGVRSILR